MRSRGAKGLKGASEGRPNASAHAVRASPGVKIGRRMAHTPPQRAKIRVCIRIATSIEKVRLWM